jgi:hypothetical protein
MEPIEKFKNKYSFSYTSTRKTYWYISIAITIILIYSTIVMTAYFSQYFFIPYGVLSTEKIWRHSAVDSRYDAYSDPFGLFLLVSISLISVFVYWVARKSMIQLSHIDNNFDNLVLKRSSKYLREIEPISQKNQYDKFALVDINYENYKRIVFFGSILLYLFTFAAMGYPIAKGFPWYMIDEVLGVVVIIPNVQVLWLLMLGDIILRIFASQYDVDLFNERLIAWHYLRDFLGRGKDHDEYVKMLKQIKRKKFMGGDIMAIRCKHCKELSIKPQEGKISNLEQLFHFDKMTLVKIRKLIYPFKKFLDKIQDYYTDRGIEFMNFSELLKNLTQILIMGEMDQRQNILNKMRSICEKFSSEILLLGTNLAPILLTLNNLNEDLKEFSKNLSFQLKFKAFKDEPKMTSRYRTRVISLTALTSPLLTFISKTLFD